MYKRFTSLLTLVILVSVVMSLPVMQADAAGSILADFESGLPVSWFIYSGGGATVSANTLVVADTDPLARPGQVGNNTILASTFDATSGYAGFGDSYAGTSPQDWSSFTGISFWFYGSGSGQSLQFELQDNRSDPNNDTAERFDVNFLDDTGGWRHINIPFADFTRATDFQPGGAPDDGLTLSEVWGWAMVLDGAAGSLYMDDLALEAAIVDDFESGLPAGTDPNGISIGFLTFNDPNSSVAISTTDTPPAQVPGFPADNHVLQVDTNVNNNGGYAGVVHAFENEAVDTWTPQDWSGFIGFSFWLYGNNTGSVLFVDILDNRNPGSTTDDAERFSIDIPDDFSGWQYFEIPFADFHRKEVGNGAPNDGFNLTEVHGWAFGVFNAGQPLTNYMDEVGLFGTAEIPELAVTFSANNYDVSEGSTGDILVKLNRPMNADDPAQVSVNYAVEAGNATPGRDYTPVSGTLIFANGGPSSLSFSLETFDNQKYTGDKRVILRLSNPVDVAPGFIMQASGTIVDNDPYDPALLDDFEQFPYLWEASENVILDNPEIPAGDDLALPDQGAYERLLQAKVPLHVDIDIQGRVCNQGNGVIPVVLLTTPDFDATTVDHTTVRMGEASEFHVDRNTGEARRHEEDADGDGDIDLVFHFRFEETGLSCDPAVVSFNGWTYSGQPITGGGSDASFGRAFALGQDWHVSDGLEFWYYGRNTGEPITVELLDNRAPDPGPAGWELVWSDEFNESAGTPPNPAFWTHEIGDGTVNGNPGWGNAELEYYTDATENAATDGQGNLVITAQEADGSYICYYGTCEYTSARLISKQKAEFAYGRIEARIQVPQGAGLWPAFWSLGTDFDRVGWPQTGEIDFMEFVGRLPNEIFGTIHGPGYSGGASFGNAYDFGEPVYNDFHTFTIEWQPDLIQWYVDGILYHSATPADIAPNQWVFNDPVFLLMNVAVGGNFGGPVGPDTKFPQSMTVDYVRVYQGPDTAERFETTFTDNFSGWQVVEVPFSSFTRSAAQPEGAPDDGLGLHEVWGYGFRLPENGMHTGSLLLDQVRLMQPSHVTVMNTNDSGAGSLRQALEIVASGGSVDFDANLAGDTITLTSGPLVVSGKQVSVDGSDAAGLTLSGGNADRVLIVDPDGSATLSNLTIADGFGWQLAGGILNNGNLTLDHVLVTNNTMATDAGDFWQGGGGIYNGEGAVLNVFNSSVANNTAGWSGGGVYAFFNSTTTILNSTISGNISNDVGGGMRSLGNAEITNSTISGNTATGWYGGAIFVTDGVVKLTNVTVADNTSPVGAPADVFIGTFTDASASLTLANSIVSGAMDNCFFAPWGTGAVTLTADHNNVFTDGTCFAGASDQVVADVQLGDLADNGGPTWTHALLAGSPAIDAADAAICLASDQRGVPRPQGAGCDVGAFEFAP